MQPKREKHRAKYAEILGAARALAHLVGTRSLKDRRAARERRSPAGASDGPPPASAGRGRVLAVADERESGRNGYQRPARWAQGGQALLFWRAREPGQALSWPYRSVRPACRKAGLGRKRT
jgi:hypothetical protein